MIGLLWPSPGAVAGGGVTINLAAADAVTLEVDENHRGNQLLLLMIISPSPSPFRSLWASRWIKIEKVVMQKLGSLSPIMLLFFFT